MQSSFQWRRYIAEKSRIATTRQRSANMPVQDSAGCRRNSFRQKGDKLPDRLRVPEGCHSSPCCFRVTIICQQLSARSEPVLESNQALVIQVGTAKINFLGSRHLTFFDEPPEQKRHAAETVESFVGAPIFVNHGRSMLQGEHRRDRNTVFPSQPDLKVVPHTLDQVSEPGSRLREQLMAPPRSQQKPVEFVHKFFRSACFIRKLFSFCSLDLSSKRILVQSSKDLLQTRSYIKLVEPVRAIRLQTITRIHSQ